MKIEQIHLKHFRNYQDLHIDFNKKINVFVGDNAQGKTNIIESIYALAITKSHRTHVDTDLIQQGEKCVKIKGVIKRDSQDDKSELEIMINGKGKKVSINKKPIRKISDYISYFNVIIFHPDDLEILKGSPSQRRKFLNIEIGQLDNRYFVILNNYNSILKNRNEYLKTISIDNYDHNYLDILNDQLANHAVKIYTYREEFINSINKALDGVNDKIKGFDKINITYEPSIPLGDAENIRNNLLHKYQANLQRDIFLSQTVVGPHRDDFVFFVNDRKAKEYGSQGQQRLAVLCLKLAEIEIFKKQKAEYPVLLLDDVFSELDCHKRHGIVKYFSKKMQIMITTTDLSDIEKTMLKNANIFLVNNAEVTKVID